MDTLANEVQDSKHNRHSHREDEQGLKDHIDPIPKVRNRSGNKRTKRRCGHYQNDLCFPIRAYDGL